MRHYGNGFLRLSDDQLLEDLPFSRTTPLGASCGLGATRMVLVLDHLDLHTQPLCVLFD